MPYRPQKSRQPPKAKPAATPVTTYLPDLSFPVSYRDQQYYVELADLFLGLDEKPRGNKVIPIDSSRPRNSRKAA